MAARPGIPTVSLREARSGSRARRADCATALREALQEFGFAAVSDHDIDPDLIRRTYDCCHRFFDLGHDEKQLVGGSPGGAPSV